jgi:hypothetical protein
MNMSAIDMVLNEGEYGRFRMLVPETRGAHATAEAGYEGCRRFLIRIVARAVLDVCLYPAGNPLHDSARSWLLSKDEDEGYLVSFRQLVDLVGIQDLEKSVLAAAQEEGVYRDKVRDMKGLLYKLSGEDDSARKPS